MDSGFYANIGQDKYNQLLEGIALVQVPDEEVLKLIYPDEKERPESIVCEVQLHHRADGYTVWQLTPPGKMALYWLYSIAPIASSNELYVFRQKLSTQEISPVCRFSDLTTDRELTAFRILMGQSGVDDKEGKENG